MIIKHAPKKSAAIAPAVVEPEVIEETLVKEEPKKKNFWEELGIEEDT